MLAFPKGMCRLVPGLHGRITRQISGRCRMPNQAQPGRPRPSRRGKAYFQRTAPCSSSTSNGARGQVSEYEKNPSSAYTFRQPSDVPTNASVPEGNM